MLNQYYRIKRFRPFGARLEIHSVVFIIVGLCVLMNWKEPFAALATALAYFGVIFIHECGHAFFARRYRYRVTRIQLSYMHGTCEYDDEDLTEWNEVVIAWGGVLAQLAVVVLVMLLGLIPGIGSLSFLKDAMGILGPVNILIAMINLIPVAPLDGATAWRIVPLLWEEWRPRRRKKKRSPFRAVK